MAVLLPRLEEENLNLLPSRAEARFYRACRSLPPGIVVLHSLGAKSGQWRENTLLYATGPNGRWHIVGTNFGGDSHPGWTYNLLANPEARVVIDGEEVPVTAVRLEPDEMALMWPRFDAVYPGYADYRKRIADSREIGMFRLEPR